MKLAPKKHSKTLDYSGLTADELLVLLQQKDAEIETQNSVISHVNKQLKDVRSERDKYKAISDELLRLATIQRFAAKSEKTPNQINLFDEAEMEAAIDELVEQDAEAEDQQGANAETTASTKAKSKTRNRGFSTSLNRIRRELLLSDEDKKGASKIFFTKVKEELDFVPAQLNVIEIWQEKAVFDQGGADERIVAAARPVHPLGKCIATTSLLAYIITSKYADGLPLYRLDGMLARLGHQVGRNNMANWIIHLDNMFKPLITLARELQNQEQYIQVDETRLQVLKETGKTAQSDKWMWVTRGGPPDKPIVLFEYDPSRVGHVPLRLLDGFTGVLQADGYAGYAKICREAHITRIGCWDHARRKFVDASRAALSSGKKTKKAKPSKADIALGKIRKLYAIESKIEHLKADEKYKIRQELAMPILVELKDWLEANRSKVLKDSLTYKAINYTLGQWDALIAYCDFGFANISNALAENAIRPFAVGRRNWLCVSRRSDYVNDILLAA